MFSESDNKKPCLWSQRCAPLFVALLFVFAALCPVSSLAQDQWFFATPEDAVKALVEAAKANAPQYLAAIFGPGSEDLISSGDPVADKERRTRFMTHYEEKNRLEQESDGRVILFVGNEDWPFPIPIVKRDGSWVFDSTEGKEEILARRIGRNELNAVQVCLAYVDAQREYALLDLNENGKSEYAHKFRSDPGKKNGLYWKTTEGEKPSPLGALFAEARKEGYRFEKPSSKASPYHGYYYRILYGQGKNAPGGAYDYVVKGKMLGGFALVAYPAQYGVSGIMTFIVNHDGQVYQKDLGENTEKIAQEMRLFDPDSTWQKVETMSSDAG